MTYTDHPIVIHTNWWNCHVYIMGETDEYIEPVFPVYFKLLGKLADISHWAENLYKIIIEVAPDKSFSWCGIMYKVNENGEVIISSKGRTVIYDYAVFTSWLFRVSTSAGALDYMEEQVRNN